MRMQSVWLILLDIALVSNSKRADLAKLQWGTVRDILYEYHISVMEGRSHTVAVHLIETIGTMKKRCMRDQLVLTDWANAHVDECCLRFVRVFVQQNVGKYVFGRMYYDADYVKQTQFYLDDLINKEHLDELDAKYRYLDYVCVDEMGTLISPHYLTAAFPKLLEKNGLRHIRFHDLRHSCASLLLANGVPMKQIQEWLGHSDFSTTANVYAHLDYNSKLSSADAMMTGLKGALTAIQ